MLPDSLLDAYLQRRLVLVIGPRASRSPTRAELARTVLTTLNARLGARADLPLFARLEQRLGERRVETVFGELKRAYAATYEQTVKAALGEPAAAAPIVEAVPALAPMLQFVVSADLRRSLEVAFGGRWRDYTSPPRDEQRHFLFKLHGQHHDASTWRLTPEEIERAMHGEPERRRFLEGMLRMMTVLFIDFDMQDRELADVRAALRAQPGVGAPHHFAYFSDGACDPEEQRELERDGIEVLSPPEGGSEAGAAALLHSLAVAQAESPGVGPHSLDVREAVAFARGGAAPRWRGTLLVVTANGRTPGQVLDIEEELRNLRDAIKGSTLSLDISPAASLPALVRDLFEVRPTILHLSAHGSASGELLLREDLGVRKVAPAEIARLLEILPARPRLVTFAACFSDELAQTAAQHAGHAIGFADRLPDASTASFARTLYERLLGGADIPTAFAAAALASGTASLARLHPRQAESR